MKKKINIKPIIIPYRNKLLYSFLYLISISKGLYIFPSFEKYLIIIFLILFLE